MSTRYRVMLDRYAERDPSGEPLLGAQVMVSIPRKESDKVDREVGVISKIKAHHEGNGRSLYNIKIKEDQRPEKDWSELTDLERDRFEILLETTYFQICDRVVKGIASADSKGEFLEQLRQLLYEEAFVPAGRIWAGIGKPHLSLTLFNCYVKQIPGDSKGAIAKHWSEIFEIFSRGGGCGWNLSILRPKGAPVRKSNGRSSGVCSWATHFAAITGTVQQGGSRRGASLQCLDIWHPDALEFMAYKNQWRSLHCHCGHDFNEFTCPKCGKRNRMEANTVWENSNISLCLTAEFMDAIERGLDWDFVFPDTSDPEYDQIWDGNLVAWRKLGKKVDVYRTMKAREVWDAIVKHAHATGDPGLLFMDRANEMSNSWYYAPLISTNPCAEEVLPSNGICNLSHLHLGKFLLPGVSSFPNEEIVDVNDAWIKVDFAKLAKAIRVGVRFLDATIELNTYHDNDIETMARGERRLGLGVLGYGEMLCRLGLKYGSRTALDFTDRLFQMIKEEAYSASVELAKEKGPFPFYKKEQFLQSKFVATLSERAKKGIAQYGIRNVTLLTAAPTGTVGVLVGTSTGIEPYIYRKFQSRSRVGITEETINIYGEMSDKFGTDYKKWPSYMVTSNEISVRGHIETVGVLQRHIDSSVSKTVNMPNSSTLSDVEEAYLLMYRLGCKGGTIYRDGSKEEQVFYNREAQAPAPTPPAPAAQSTNIIDVELVSDDNNESLGASGLQPGIRYGRCLSESYDSPLSSLHPFLRFHPKTGEPYDFFLEAGKGDVHADAQAMARLISMILRWPNKVTVPQSDRLQLIVKQLFGIHGRGQMGLGPDAVYSQPDGIAKFLAHYLSASYPMPGLPMGTDQVPAFIAAIRSCRSEEEAMNLILTGVAAPTKPVEEEPPTGPGAEGHFDLCPNCNGPSLVRVPGHCTYCINQSCGYSECS
jgi:ribonucleoside-diphosphate reductase alpha chain